MNLIDLIKSASETEKILFIICGLQWIAIFALIFRTDSHSLDIKRLESYIKSQGMNILWK